jgi:hypothetical protein
MVRTPPPARPEARLRQTSDSTLFTDFRRQNLTSQSTAARGRDSSIRPPTRFAPARLDLAAYPWRHKPLRPSPLSPFVLLFVLDAKTAPALTCRGDEPDRLCPRRVDSRTSMAPQLINNLQQSRPSRTRASSGNCAPFSSHPMEFPRLPSRRRTNGRGRGRPADAMTSCAFRRVLWTAAPSLP